MNKKIFYLLPAILFLLSGCEAEKQSVMSDVTPGTSNLNSSEYKLLLNPSKFENYETAFASYWQIVQDVAAKEGLAVISSENPLKLKQKQVCFFDTQDLDFRKSGFLLRKRTKYKNGKEIPLNEYTVKYLRPTAEEALAADLTLGHGYVPKDDEIELESDIVYYSAANGAEKTTYCLSNSTLMDDQPNNTVSAFSNIFPALGKLDIPGATEIKKVAGISAIEWKVSPGELDFGQGLIVEMDMTVWILETKSGRVNIPEFSFDHSFVEDKVWDKNAMLKCTSFMHKLHDAHPEWIVPGAPKSTVLFEIDRVAE